jgi:hypothetical protein
MRVSNSKDKISLLELQIVELKKANHLQKEALEQAALEVKCLNKALKEKSAALTQSESKLAKSRNNFGNFKRDSLLREKELKNSFDHVKHHSYGFLLIRLCVFLHCRLNLSLRQVSSVVEEFSLSFELGQKAPSHESIRLWSLKLGYHRGTESYKELSNSEVCLIVDESFQLGEESLLLILGVNLDFWHSRLDTDKILNHDDVEVLAVESGKSWTGEDIERVLLEVKTKLEKEGASVSYVVSDRGSAILKSLKMSDLVSIWDCTHYLASFLENNYKNDASFKVLMSELVLLRKKWQIGGNSCLIPPKLRSKSRYLNLFEVVKWAESVSLSLKKDLVFWTDERRAALAFLDQYQPLIAEMNLICNAIKFSHKQLKNNGLSQKSVAEMTQYFQLNKVINAKYNAFEQYILSYYDDMMKRKPEQKNLIASSDIIESLFGKVKYRKRYLAYQSFHKSIFILPLMTKNISPVETKKALEKFTCKQILDKINDKLATSVRQNAVKNRKEWKKSSA